MESKKKKFGIHLTKYSATLHMFNVYLELTQFLSYLFSRSPQFDLVDFNLELDWETANHYIELHLLNIRLRVIVVVETNRSEKTLEALKLDKDQYNISLQELKKELDITTVKKPYWQWHCINDWSVWLLPWKPWNYSRFTFATIYLSHNFLEFGLLGFCISGYKIEKE